MCTQGISHFWAENGAIGSALLQWEAFKSYFVRGVYGRGEWVQKAVEQ